MTAQMVMNSIATPHSWGLTTPKHSSSRTVVSPASRCFLPAQARRPRTRLETETSNSISEGIAKAEAEVKKGRRTAFVKGTISMSLGVGYLASERFRVSNMRVRAHREVDWEKLFKAEAMKKEELKEYLNEDPIWLWVFKSWYSGINGALQFLWSQPSTVKYIEWPSIKSTVKMALLTLVVVMFLMVFLYSVDSLFRYILKSSMRPMA
ncbi:hypothetical protein M758_UG059300 [Ceratodon purpureus]|nr:hypothetical protein M758_UG059300 [Ceratodon purpureus]